MSAGQTGKRKHLSGKQPTLKHQKVTQQTVRTTLPQHGHLYPSMSLWKFTFSEHVPAGTFGSVGSPSDADTRWVVPLGEVLGRSSNSTVYQVKLPRAEKAWAIKYYAFCSSDDGSHAAEDSIARETLTLQLLNRLEPEVAPEHLLTSDAIRILPEAGKGKLFYEPPPCASRDFPLVRYMIMERVSSTLFKLLDHHGQIPFPIATAMTLQVVRLLRKMHAHNIVHGDIHVANVAIRNRGPKQLVLIDFGLSRHGELVESSAYSPPQPERRLWCHGFISSWESLGWLSAFRDDIFRAIQMMAILIHGIRYYQTMEGICNQWASQQDRLQYYTWKSEHNFFDAVFKVPSEDGEPMTHDFSLHKTIGIGEDTDTLASVHKLLEHLLVITRAPATPMEKPNYSQIESILTNLITITHDGFGPDMDPAHIDFTR